MKVKILFILAFCLLAVLPAVGQTVAYSFNDNPVFSRKRKFPLIPMNSPDPHAEVSWRRPAIQKVN